MQSISILQKLISSVQDNCLLHKKAFHFSKANTSNFEDTVKWTNEQKQPRMDTRNSPSLHNTSPHIFGRRFPAACMIVNEHVSIEFGETGRTWCPWGHSEKGNSPLRYSPSQSWSIGDGRCSGLDDFLVDWLLLWVSATK